MKQEPRFIRAGKLIIDLESGDDREFTSLRKAKKESRRLQKENGGYGCGALVTLPYGYLL